MIFSDTIIIGGGPAGSTCAWKLKQEGIDCIVLDKKVFPRTKLCAGWITPQVLSALELDPKDYPHSLTTFDKLHYHIGGIRLGIKTRQYAIRRSEFDNWLLERAGVPVQHHEAHAITRDGDDYIIDNAYRCRHLVGAGGTHCPVYRTFFAKDHPRADNSLIVSMEEEFTYNYKDDRCHLWFFENKLRGYSWYVPKKNGYVNIGIGGMATRMKRRNMTIREHWDMFFEKLRAGGLVDERSFQPKGYTYYLRQNNVCTQLDRCYLVGDAAGLATKDLGEGIGPAIQSGILTAESIIRGTPYILKSIPKYSMPRILLGRS